MGQGLNIGYGPEKRWALANRCFMCLHKEENINHLLLHCSRTRALWDLLFALFGVSWVLPFSVRKTLLSWNGFSWAKIARRRGELLLFTFFGRFGRRGIDWLSRMNRCQFKD